MSTERLLLNHFLAALAYRTQKALRDAPAGFGDFRPQDGVRSPVELVRHMTSVLGYACTLFTGGRYRPDPLPTLDAEIARFHQMIERLAGHIESTASLGEGVTTGQLLQGPLADAMTHVGQLAMLRRLAGAPVQPENFVFAEIDPARLGRDQARPARPDPVWPEAPPGWVPQRPE
ncbi:MAG TPA: DinB family protein [Gemmatimonadales bacterium]|nr:DinB family protein [Gemmatimonadales bacterium]